MFSRVWLVDMDLNAIKKAKEELPGELQEKVALVEADLTGVVYDFCIEMQKSIKSSETIDEFIGAIPGVVDKIERKFSELPNNLPGIENRRVAFGCSHLVHSQLCIPGDYIAEALMKKFGFSEGTVMALADYFDYKSVREDEIDKMDTKQYKAFRKQYDIIKEGILYREYRSNPTKLYAGFMAREENMAELFSLWEKRHIDLLGNLVEEEGWVHIGDTFIRTEVTFDKTKRQDVTKNIHIIDRPKFDSLIGETFVKSEENPIMWKRGQYTVKAFRRQVRPSEIQPPETSMTSSGSLLLNTSYAPFADESSVATNWVYTSSSSPYNTSLIDTQNVLGDPSNLGFSHLSLEANWREFTPEDTLGSHAQGGHLDPSSDQTYPGSGLQQSGMEYRLYGESLAASLEAVYPPEWGGSFGGSGNVGFSGPSMEGEFHQFQGNTIDSTAQKVVSKTKNESKKKKKKKKR